MSGVSSEERERLEENLADVEEATEQRMHSVADLVPPRSEEIHERADLLSESAEGHRQRVQRRRAEGDEDGLTAWIQRRLSADLPYHPARHTGIHRRQLTSQTNRGDTRGLPGGSRGDHTADSRIRQRPSTVESTQAVNPRL
jgi:hypothetical protein